MKKQDNFTNKWIYCKEPLIVMLKETLTKRQLILQKMLSQDLLQVYKKDGETIYCPLSKPKQLLTTSLRLKKFKRPSRHQS
jgi:hypothetical protein